MGYTSGEAVRATPDWLRCRKEMEFEVRYRPVAGDCHCDWCQEFIPKGSNAAKVGRVVNELYSNKGKPKVRHEFQRHALLCSDCGGRYERDEL